MSNKLQDLVECWMQMPIKIEGWSLIDLFYASKGFNKCNILCGMMENADIPGNDIRFYITIAGIGNLIDRIYDEDFYGSLNLEVLDIYASFVHDGWSIFYYYAKLFGYECCSNRRDELMKKSYDELDNEEKYKNQAVVIGFLLTYYMYEFYDESKDKKHDILLRRFYNEKVRGRNFVLTQESEALLSGLLKLCLFVPARGRRRALYPTMCRSNQRPPQLDFLNRELQ